MCQKASEYPPPSSEYPSSSLFYKTPNISQTFDMSERQIKEKDNEGDKVFPSSEKSINISFSQNQIKNNNNNTNLKVIKNSYQDDKMENQNIEIITKLSSKNIEQSEKMTTKNIKGNKTIRKERLRTSYLKHFYSDLVIFINFLINKFNKEKGKNFKFLIEKNTELYIKYGAKDAKKMLERKAKDVLSEEKVNIKNKENINLINMIINADNENKNIEVIEVLNKTIQELMDIYRNDKIHKDDYFQNFQRFPDFLKKCQKSEDEKSMLEYQAFNYEKIINNIIENSCRPGPRPKNK